MQKDPRWWLFVIWGLQYMSTQRTSKKCPSRSSQVGLLHRRISAGREIWWLTSPSATAMMWGVKAWPGMPARKLACKHDHSPSHLRYAEWWKKPSESIIIYKHNQEQRPRTNQSLHNYLQWEQPTVFSCWNLEAVPGAAFLFLEFVGKLLAGCQVSGLQVV